jgi:hypothetical protein
MGDEDPGQKRITIICAGCDSIDGFRSDRGAVAIATVWVRWSGQHDAFASANRDSAGNEYDHGYGEFWKPDVAGDTTYPHRSLK